MSNMTQLNLRISKEWKNKLEKITLILKEEMKSPDLNIQDVIRLTIAEKFDLD